MAGSASELACVYASLILHDDGLEISVRPAAAALCLSYSCKLFVWAFELGLFNGPRYKDALRWRGGIIVGTVDSFLSVCVVSA